MPPFTNEFYVSDWAGRNGRPPVTSEIGHYHQAEMEWLLSVLHPNDDVLEFGCGDGRVVEYLASAVASVIGVDISPGRVEIASHRCAHVRNAKFVASTPTHVPLPDVTIDAVVIAWNTFGTLWPARRGGQSDDALLPDIRAEMLSELRRIMRPDARLYVSAYADNPAGRIMQREFYALNAAENPAWEIAHTGEHFIRTAGGLESWRFSPKSLPRALALAGFVPHTAQATDLAGLGLACLAGLS
jgi:SAM-dependent methyltransferase